MHLQFISVKRLDLYSLLTSSLGYLSVLASTKLINGFTLMNEDTQIGHKKWHKIKQCHSFGSYIISLLVNQSTTFIHTKL